MNIEDINVKISNLETQIYDLETEISDLESEKYDLEEQLEYYYRELDEMEELEEVLGE